MNAIRKSVIRIVLMFSVCILGFIVIFSKKETIQIPVPDQILIYQNGGVYEVSPGSREFSDVYSWCNEIRKQYTMESAIDENSIGDIKSQISLEYTYSEIQTLKMDGCERKFFKLLFCFEGQDNVIVYDSGYESGTYKLDINKMLMKVRLQKIARKF